MAIDGLIVLDNNGRPIVQTNFRTSQAVYPLLHVDAFNDALAKAPRAQLDPVLYVSTPSGPSVCCHVKHGGLRILCPMSDDSDPLSAFAFLRTFVAVLEDYLGDLSAASIRENFDVVYQLLEEMLDNGHPLTTEPNALRDIVIPPSFFNKILSVAGASGLSKATANPFSSPIPWRKPGVKHANNEIYFDVVEDLRAIVGKTGATVSSEVQGKIKAHSKLSGTPDLLLAFTRPQVLKDPSFHPCVRLKNWTRDKSLSFVPPDGHFTLMEYRYTPGAGTANGAVSLGANHVPLPVALKAGVELSESGGSFTVTATSRLSKKMSRVILELYVGEDATGANCSYAPPGVAFSYDPQTKTLKIETKNLAPSAQFKCEGAFTARPGTHPRPARAFQVSFVAEQHTFSALAVDQLRVTGEAYKTYKGVRGSSTGKIEWRW